MSETMTTADLQAWEAQQPLAFELVDGGPVRLPDEDQGSSRLARLRQVALKVMGDEAAVTTWLSTPQVRLGGLEPEALAADSEEGCQTVLRTLVFIGRQREAAGV